jgi:hypothetical protein
MGEFGCCSHYVECSDVGKCIFTSDPDYDGCQYSKNLDAGRNFYSTVVIKQNVQPVKKPERIYLDCYNRCFNVGKLSKEMTYRLSDIEINAIIDNFKKLEIPHVIDTVPEKCIMDGDAEEPANNRVTFKVPENEQTFVIANYNSCYIKKKYAEGIAKALKMKGIAAETQLVGQYWNK